MFQLTNLWTQKKGSLRKGKSTEEDGVTRGTHFAENNFQSSERTRISYCSRKKIEKKTIWKGWQKMLVRISGCTRSWIGNKSVWAEGAREMISPYRIPSAYMLFLLPPAFSQHGLYHGIVGALLQMIHLFAFASTEKCFVCPSSSKWVLTPSRGPVTYNWEDCVTPFPSLTTWSLSHHCAYRRAHRNGRRWL